MSAVDPASPNSEAAAADEGIPASGTPDTSARFFERMYRASDDPWSFATSGYERERYRAIVSYCEGSRFNSGFEPGCSIGVLTEQLASLTARLTAMDFALPAVERARARCGQLPQVRVVHGALAPRLPDAVLAAAPFDLVVLAEIGYYFDRPELGRILQSLEQCFAPATRVIACHWLGVSRDHVLRGIDVHDALHAQWGSPGLSHATSEPYILDVWNGLAPA